MKRIVALFLCIFLLVGCSEKGVSIEKTSKDFNLYEGKSIAKEFMKNLVQERYEENRTSDERRRLPGAQCDDARRGKIAVQDV